MRPRKYTCTSYNDLNKADARKGFLVNSQLIRIHTIPQKTPISYGFTIFSLKCY